MRSLYIQIVNLKYLLQITE